ncbi:MAG: hypothetical protein CMM73_06120 [Rhodospirillaceae bacterium]|nr:hypothetical protein [Rhodospirillaceae bacterium]
MALPIQAPGLISWLKFGQLDLWPPEFWQVKNLVADELTDCCRFSKERELIRPNTARASAIVPMSPPNFIGLTKPSVKLPSMA